MMRLMRRFLAQRRLRLELEAAELRARQPSPYMTSAVWSDIDVVTHILSLCGIAAGLRASLVSSHFRLAAQDEGLWRRLCASTVHDACPLVSLIRAGPIATPPNLPSSVPVDCSAKPTVGNASPVGEGDGQDVTFSWRRTAINVRFFIWSCAHVVYTASMVGVGDAALMHT